MIPKTFPSQKPKLPAEGDMAEWRVKTDVVEGGGNVIRCLKVPGLETHFFAVTPDVEGDTVRYSGLFTVGDVASAAVGSSFQIVTEWNDADSYQIPPELAELEYALAAIKGSELPDGYDFTDILEP